MPISDQRYRITAARFLDLASRSNDPDRKARLVALAEVLLARVERSRSQQQQQQQQQQPQPGKTDDE